MGCSIVPKKLLYFQLSLFCLTLRVFLSNPFVGLFISPTLFPLRPSSHHKFLVCHSKKKRKTRDISAEKTYEDDTQCIKRKGLS